ncbi:MAG: caspase family protein, partial [Desulfobacterales bacterium]
YKDRKIPPLHFTVADAQGMYNVLTNEKYGFLLKENVKILINEEASTQNIKKTFGTWLKTNVKENDFVIVYFAGHGAPEAGSTYWVTYDSDIEDLYGTAISNESISKMLNSIESKTIIVFLDSCYSAATVNRGWHTRSLIEKDPFEEFKGEGRVVITSSNGKQLSLEIQEYGHGVFTHYLIQGLIGKADQDLDGYVTLDEIWDYVKFNVTHTAKKFGIHQTPIIDGRHSSGILLSKYPKE